MFRIICECGHEFDRRNICNPKTLRTWVCPRQQAAERKGGTTLRGRYTGGKLRSFNIDGHRTRIETTAERFSRLLDIAQNGWAHERAAAAATLRKEGTYHVEP